MTRLMGRTAVYAGSCGGNTGCGGGLHHSPSLALCVLQWRRLKGVQGGHMAVLYLGVKYIVLSLSSTTFWPRLAADVTSGNLSSPPPTSRIVTCKLWSVGFRRQTAWRGSFIQRLACFLFIYLWIINILC